jgi:hypothetical protein
VTPDDERLFTERRRGRNLAIGLALGALALLTFGITVARMKI